MNKPYAIKSGLRLLAKIILRLEWFWIACMIVGFWFRSPPFRENYVFLLGFAIPIYGARWIVHRRFFTRTPLDWTFLIFILLSVYNFYNAPISRSDYWVLLCRPFLGFLIVYYFVDSVRQRGHTRYVTAATVLLGILIGLLALVASQWGASPKSDLFMFIIERLPVLDYRQVLPDMQLSFNPNEIAGALAYFCSFLLAIALAPSQLNDVQKVSFVDRALQLIIHYGSIIGFMIVALALLLGQSRFALFGVFAGTLLVILLILPDWKRRLSGLVVWSLVVILEVMIVANLLPLNFSSTEGSSIETSVTLSERDERTLSSRFDLWESALRMVLDYPTTGAGMSTYRALIMREEYITPLYEGRQYGPPHAHNVFFQMGADFGVMGFVLFMAWYGSVAWMAFQTYQKSSNHFKIMTIGITSGILAYMGYGMGDTITLWDRFAFIHWWFIGLLTSVYILQRYIITSDISS